MTFQNTSIYGLRLENNNDDGLDNLFSNSDSDEENMIILTQNKLNVSRNINNTIPPNEIKSYNEINSIISNFANSLIDFIDSFPYQKDIDFIPEGTSSSDLQISLLEFIETKNFEKFQNFLNSFNKDFFTESILAQIDIIKFYSNQNSNLLIYNLMELDSRILSLIYFLLIDNNSIEISLSFCIKCCIEYIKSEELAPISVLFPNFNLSNILFKLCNLLVKKFPNNPLIPSVLHKLSNFSKEKEQIISLIPQNEIDDDDDDSNFDDIIALRNNNNNNKIDGLILPSLSESDFSNLLQLGPSLINLDVIVLPETPSTMTYEIKEQLTPDLLVQWLISHRKYELNNNENGFFLLYYHIGRGEDLRKYFPKTIGINDWGLILPAIHHINSRTNSPFLLGSIFPDILSEEFYSHKALKENDNLKLNSILINLSLKIDIKNLKKSNLIPLEIKRKFEFLSSQPFNSVCSSALCLTDICLILKGRSPLTLMIINNNNLSDFNLEDELSSFTWRTQTLYNLYINNSFPPYIAFRISFTLGIMLNDQFPTTSIKFLFESIYILLTNYPQIYQSIWSKAIYLALAEAFEINNKYYFSAICYDSAWILSEKDYSFTMKISKFARKNQDLLRAIYYSIESLKYFLTEKRFDEAVYTTQGIADIYKENNLINDGIQILYFLLKNIYNLSIPEGSLSKLNTSPAIRRRKNSNEISPDKSPISSRVHPKANAINTILTAITLCKLLVKKNQFNLAKIVINQVSKCVTIASVLKMLKFLLAKIAYHSNNFNDFLFYINQQQLITKTRPRSMSTKYVSTGPIIMDTVGISIKLLSKSYVLWRNDYFLGIFWSEMLCYFGMRNSFLKDIGIGFFLRGISLNNLFKEKNIYGETFNIHTDLSPFENSFGTYCTEGTITSKILLSQSLASFLISKISFERIGLISKSLESLIEYCDLLLNYSFDTIIQLNGEFENIIISNPLMFTAMKSGFQPVEPPYSYETIIITKNNLIDYLTPLIRSIHIQNKILMNPIYIIRSQILNCFLSFLKNNIKESKTYFDMSFNNLKNYFFNGQRFLARDLSIIYLNQFSQILNNLLLILSQFDKEFIDERLILFDMINDLTILIKNKQRNTIPEPFIELNNSLQISPTILELRNPGCPDFNDLITSTNKKNDKIIIEDLLKKIKLNIKLFIQEKITEKKLIEKNTSCCRKMILLSNDQRRSRHSLMLSELPTTCQSSVLYIYKIKNRIFTYYPLKGQKNFINLNLISLNLLNIKTNFNNISINCGSSLFSNSFLLSLSYLIIPNSIPKKKLIFGDEFFKECNLLKELLFKDITFEFLENIIIPDDNLFNESKLFGKGLKGCLTSISINSTPLMIVSDNDLQVLPYEYMFNNCNVIRSSSFFNSTFRSRSSKGPLKPVVIKKTFLNNEDELNQNFRSENLCFSILYQLGTIKSPSIYVNNFERYFPFPFPLFEKNKEIDKYIKDYPFCIFRNEDDKSFPDEILIMTFSDYFEWPPFLDKIIHNGFYSCILFVPGFIIKDCFDELNLIFERHQRRKLFLNLNKIENQKKILEDPFQFIGTIQLTLMKKLKVPIILFLPNRVL